MNPVIGWALAAAGIAAGFIGWGWRGAVLGVSVGVFWLLLLFSRSLRVLKLAGQAPVGQVDSAARLQRQLRQDMTLLQVLLLTRSLGRKLGDAPEAWGWVDADGLQLRLEMQAGKLQRWTLQRADQAAP